MTEIVFTDRYQALGMPYPEPATMCKGQCEGTGVYPLFNPPLDARLRPGDWLRPAPQTLSVAERDAWEREHAQAHKLSVRVRSFLRLLPTFGLRVQWHLFWKDARCDGWHFITCPNCGGTGKRVKP